MQHAPIYLKQKPRLYFDANFPPEVIEHFRSPFWKKRLWLTSAREQGQLGQSDWFHYMYCQRHRYTLVSLDADFNNDRRYPFTHGKMPGIIIVQASSSEVQGTVDGLARLLDFVTKLPLPKSFLGETKCIVARDGVIMRGRDSVTRELKSLHVRAGVTTTRQVRAFFHY
jgi:predicted nuclease of predicted toxin-antitoxin system